MELSRPFWDGSRHLSKTTYIDGNLCHLASRPAWSLTGECVNEAGRHLVFVVEDDGEVRASTRALLEASGYAVREFASGEDLIASGDAATAGCIVLDYNLSGMSGLDMLRSLRTQGIETPAIMVSGSGKQAIQAAAAAGIVAVLRKPLSADALEQWLEQVFSASR